MAGLTLALAAPAAVAVAGQTAPPTTHLQDLSAIDVFGLADRARAAGRIDDATGFYDALAHDPNADVRAEARFRKGMMLADLRRYREAALAFRAVLDEQPKAARARLELARMLAALGDERAARRELRQAQATGLPGSVAAAVGQFDQILRSHKRFGGSFELALAPDSNVNRATQVRTLDTIIAPLTLSNDARAQSGVGLRLAGQGYARLGLADGLALVPRLSTLANLYRASQFNDISGTALIGFEWQRQKDRFSPSIGRTWRWYGGALYAHTDAVSLDWLHILGRRAQLVVSGSASKATYRRNDLQDGAIGDLNVSIERALSAKAGASIGVSITRQTARDPGYATKAAGVSALGWRELGQTTVFVSGGLRRTEGDAALFLFGDRRREWLMTARAGATFRQLKIGAFSPYIRVSYERNASSLQLYQYARTASEVGITRAF
ncbi:surface lipoprotein assembly modifier [Sphingomonas echinoides]|uniref:Surface lipoprotein assembly modifier n=1 Tax=Sphingomonas echinoides TaxID=59803 RepID=A0ABU4PEX9_9SPHN|nr:surface lipoprotein assembly modifier [Sphingomonas echinoides]MDX5982776.1 surface lipoprotein assembly modifier [Sphingomonas echinoides]